MKSNRFYIVLIAVCAAVAVCAFVFALTQRAQLVELKKQADAVSSRLEDASRQTVGLHSQYNELNSQYEALQSSIASLGGDSK